MSLAPHAPYSVSPALFAVDRRQRCGVPLTSVHLGESPEEVDVPAPRRRADSRARSRRSACGIRTGRRRAAGRWSTSIGSGYCPSGCWPCTACSSPTPTGAAGVALAPTLVTCPRSNRWVGRRQSARRQLLRVRASASRSAPTAWPASRISTCSRSWRQIRALAPGRPGAGASRQRHAHRRRGARIRRRLRHDRAGKARGADRRARPGRRGRCGRISGQRHRRQTSAGWMSAGRPPSPETRAPSPEDVEPRESTEHLRLVRPLQPFGLCAAVCADRRAAGDLRARAARHGVRRSIWARGVDRRGDGRGAQRGDGLQPAGRRPSRRAQPAHGDARAAARRDDRARGDAVRRRLQPRRSSARPPSSARSVSRSRRSRWRSCSGIRSPSASRPTRSCFSGWRWRWRRSAAGSRRAAGQRLAAVAARSGDRHLGRRLRRAVCLPGSRRSIARRAALDPGPLRRRRDRSSSRARCTSSPSPASPRWGRWRDLGWIYGAGVVGVALLLVYEQSLVSEHDLSQVKRAFDLNG